MSFTAYTKRIYLYLIALILIAAAGTSCDSLKKASAKKASADTYLSDKLIDYSKKFLGKPYRYASRGPHSFDCSGFTSYVFKEFGYHLNPSSAAQGQQFPVTKNKKDLKKGDLVFFEGRSHNGRVGHVGIVTDVGSNGKFKFIHASTSNGVIISSSDEQYYASRYLHGGRVLNENAVQLAQKKGGNAYTPAQRKSENVYKPAQKKKENAYIPAQRKPSRKVIPTETDIMNSSPVEVAGVAPTSNEDSLIVEIFSREVDTPSKVKVTQANPLEDIHSTKQKEKEEEVPQDTTTQAVLREENITLPEPIVTEEKGDFQPKHTVRPGETLYSIARQYGCTVEQLRLSNPNLDEVLKAGDSLVIPQ